MHTRVPLENGVAVNIAFVNANYSVEVQLDEDEWNIWIAPGSQATQERFRKVMTARGLLLDSYASGTLYFTVLQSAPEKARNGLAGYAQQAVQEAWEENYIRT